MHPGLTGSRREFGSPRGGLVGPLKVFRTYVITEPLK